MDATIVKLVAAGVIGAHGIGHVLGSLPAVGVTLPGMSSRSWLLSGPMGEAGATVAAGVIFALPLVGFVAAAVGLATGQPWWRQVAIGSAVLSLAGTALFPHGFTTSSTVGSVVVNLVILYGLVVAGWGSEAPAA